MHVPLIDLKQRYIEEKDDIINIIDQTLTKGNLVLTRIMILKMIYEICRISKLCYIEFGN